MTAAILTAFNQHQARLKALLKAIGAAAVLVAVVLPSLVQGMGNDPRKWINRMHIAVDTTNYQGTLVRTRLDADAEAGSVTETFRIYHRAVDDDAIERLVGMDGEGFEVIRNRTETVCIFPAQRALVIEKRADGPKSPLQANLPAYSEVMEGHYRFEVIADDRVAGRDTKVLQIAAADDYRYGYRIWIDTRTGMPLKSQLRSADGKKLLEEVLFADIALPNEVPKDLVMSAYDTSDYEQLMPDDGKVMEAAEDDIPWVADMLPPGFTLNTIRYETMSGEEEPRLHLVYTDGLASVSVFVDTAAPGQSEGSEAMGSTHAFTTMSSGYMVTAVGQVPAATARQIAAALRYKP